MRTPTDAPMLGTIGERWTNPDDEDGRWTVEWTLLVCRDPTPDNPLHLDGCGSVRGGWYPARAIDEDKAPRDHEGRILSPCKECLAKLDGRLAWRARKGF